MLNFSEFFSRKSDSQTNVSHLKKNLSGSEQVVINAIEDGVVVIGSDANIYLINPAAEKMLGWTSGDAGGLNYASIFKIVDEDGKELADTASPIHKALNNFQPSSSRDIHLKTQSGKVIPIFLTLNPINNQQAGIVAVFRNIAKELKENREQAEFISTASHEMRTPVASIEGYLGLALNPNTATIDDRAREYITKAHESTQHLGRLFQDLLDITKADDGKLKNDPKVINTSNFIKSIWEGFKVKAEEKGLKYTYDPSIQKGGEKQLTPVFFAHADKDHLREVVDNLIENAIKYTPSGEVSVNVTGDNEVVEISVHDSGIGIPAEDISHLFQKFYRVDNTDTREIGGTGLGLYLSRRLVESMGGKIIAESEYRKGSTFKIILPRLSSDEARRLQEAQDQADWNNHETPIEDVKLTSETFTPVVSEAKPKQEYFSAEDAAAMIRQQMTQQNLETASQEVAQTSEIDVGNSQPVQPEITPDSATNSVATDPQNVPQTPTIDQTNTPSGQIPAQPAPMPPQPNFASPARQVQNLAPRPRDPQPSAPPRQPTLSDIEKMKEEYVRRMATGRQN